MSIAGNAMMIGASATAAAVIGFMSKSVLQGPSVEDTTNDFVKMYDKNHDGSISLAAPTGYAPWSSDERTRSFSNHRYVGPDSPVESILPILQAADADHNGQVTKPELKAEVSRYDENKNGRLGGQLFFFGREENNQLQEGVLTLSAYKDIDYTKPSGNSGRTSY